jgi:hypothetical protein
MTSFTHDFPKRLILCKKKLIWNLLLVSFGRRWAGGRIPMRRYSNTVVYGRYCKFASTTGHFVTLIPARVNFSANS